MHDPVGCSCGCRRVRTTLQSTVAEVTVAIIASSGWRRSASASRRSTPTKFSLSRPCRSAPCRWCCVPGRGWHTPSCRELLYKVNLEGGRCRQDPGTALLDSIGPAGVGDGRWPLCLSAIGMDAQPQRNSEGRAVVGGRERGGSLSCGRRRRSAAASWCTSGTFSTTRRDLGPLEINHLRTMRTVS